jgi:hypothetical protein
MCLNGKHKLSSVGNQYRKVNHGKTEYNDFMCPLHKVLKMYAKMGMCVFMYSSLWTYSTDFN